MVVLALETVTRAGSIALLDGARLLDTRRGNPDRPHAVRLPGALMDLLTENGVALEAVERLAVCVGPGSFTGIRIGIAAMQGMATATGLPVAGISALDALAAAALAGAPPCIAVLADAARGEVFARRYDVRDGRPWPLEEAVSVTPETLLAHWAAEARRPMRWVGDGAVRYADVITGAIGRSDIVRPVPLIAPWVARLAVDAPAGRPHALRPVYVRAPDAELARARRAAGTPGA